MMSYPPLPRDPYADLRRPTPPRDRRRHPLDSSEPYVTRFTTAPIKQNPRTGSLYYRCGMLKDRPMTPKELQFEEYGNEQQAIRDEINDLKEWRRLKDLEEEAIALYHDLGENLEEYTTQMRTRDQMEMELQCGRNKQIEKDLSVNSQRAWAAARSIPSAMEQERIKVATASIRADFKAGVEATMAKTKISTNATESQQASQQSEPTRSKPKKHDNASQSGSSAEAGSPSSPRQQQERTKASPEEICRQLQGQAQNKTQSPPTTIGQPTCSRPSIGAGSFKQQEEKEQPSPEETRRQFMEDVRKKAAKAGLSRHQERKSELSSEGGCSKSQASVRVQPPAPDRVPTTTKKVRTVPPQSPAYAPTRRFRDGNIFARPYGCRPAAAERQQETRINHGCPSSVEQSRAHNTYQSSDTSRENRVIRSTEHSPKSPSPEKSSNSTSPDRVSDSPSPEKSSKSTSPDQDPYGKPPSPSPADPSAPRVPVVQTVPISNPYLEWLQDGSITPEARRDPSRPSIQRSPSIEEIYRRKMEVWEKIILARRQEWQERLQLREFEQERAECERKKKLACQDEACRETSRQSQQKAMSSQELIEVCSRTCSLGEPSQQEGPSSQQGPSKLRRTATEHQT